MISKERLALANPIGGLGHIRRLGILAIDIPVAMTHRPGNAHIGQPQNLVFLCVVVRFAVTSLAEPCQSIDLVLVR